MRPGRFDPTSWQLPDSLPTVKFPLTCSEQVPVIPLLSLGDSRHKRPHPGGGRWQITERWLKDVEAELAKRDVSNVNGWHGRARAELARKLDVSKSAITKLLSGKQGVSALVPRISAILEVDMPVLGAADDLIEFRDLLLGLQPEDRAVVLDLAKRLSRPRK